MTLIRKDTLKTFHPLIKTAPWQAYTVTANYTANGSPFSHYQWIL